MPYLLPLCIPVAVIGGFAQGALWPIRLVLPVFALVVVLDLVLGEGRGRRLRQPRGRVGAKIPQLVPWLWVPAQLALVLIGLSAAADPALSGYERFGLAVCLGMANGMLIAPAAHELMHRSGRWARGAARVQMALMSYAHFCIEHVHGHHARVATPADPASARIGRSVYGHLPRVLVGSFVGAWRIERQRLRRCGRAPNGVRNGVLGGLALQAILCLVIALAFGSGGLLVFVAQSAIAVSIIETFNYVQHYGLVRQRQADGSYEPPSPAHSWNSEHPVSNWFTLNLGRHSHHHCRAGVAFEALHCLPDAPRLPTGLYGMWLLAWFPPLWFAVMDPLAAARLGVSSAESGRGAGSQGQDAGFGGAHGERAASALSQCSSSAVSNR